MKRFMLKSKRWGTVIATVDEEDAHLLRNFIWTVSGTASPQVARRVDGEVKSLSHVIVGAKRGEFVRHLNGCQLDFRKDNLAIDIRVRKAA